MGYNMDCLDGIVIKEMQTSLSNMVLINKYIPSVIALPAQTAKSKHF